jgi:hypothetical protein
VEPAAGDPELLEVEQLDQAQGDQPVEQGALPTGEDIDRAGGEAPQQGLAARGRRLAGAAGQGAIEAAGHQRQLAFEQGQHGAQIGRLRQAVTPAPLQGLDHRRADAGLLGQLAQAQAPFLPGLPQPLARLLERILGKGKGHAGGDGIPGAPQAPPQPAQPAGGRRGQGGPLRERR